MKEKYKERFYSQDSILVKTMIFLKRLGKDKKTKKFPYFEDYLTDYWKNKKKKVAEVERERGRPMSECQQTRMTGSFGRMSW